jgi:hypothetical protein
LNILYDNKKIDKKIFDETNEFLEKNKYVSLSEAASPAKVFFFHYLKSQFEIVLITNFFKSKPLDFETRSKLSKNKIGKKLFDIMSLKQTNLCLAADFNNFDQLLKVKFYYIYDLSFNILTVDKKRYQMI